MGGGSGHMVGLCSSYMISIWEANDWHMGGI